jgi:hypothetical protein
MIRRRQRPASRRLDATPIDPGAEAARARVEHMLEEMTRVELQVIVVSLPDATRLAAQERARDAALLAGRDTLLRDAIAAAREATMTSFARSGFSGTWALTEAAISVATSADRVAAAAAFEEAAMAAVVEDVVDEETIEILRSTSEGFGRARGMPSPGSIAAFATPAPSTMRGPLQMTVIASLVVISVVIGLVVGYPFGLLLLALGVAIATGLARRWRQPGP